MRFLIALLVAVCSIWLGVSTAHATKYQSCYASRYGTPGECGGHTACGLTLTRSSVWTAHRNLPLHSAVEIRWRGASIKLRVLDRGPASWTGCQFDLTNKAVCTLEWRANWRAIYKGWYWHTNKDGSKHKWRRWHWKQIHRYVWDGHQHITWRLLKT